MTDTHSREHLVHGGYLMTSSDNLGALGRIGDGIFAHTGLFGDRFGVWGDARAGHNAEVHSI